MINFNYFSNNFHPLVWWTLVDLGCFGNLGDMQWGCFGNLGDIQWGCFDNLDDM